MNGRLVLFVLAVLSVVSITSASSAYAHKSQVIGDYNVEAGWNVEPPVVGLDNAVTVMITPASADDKAASDKALTDMKDMTDEQMAHMDDTMTADEHHDEEAVPTNGISGLASSLDVAITVNGEKTSLNMVEDEEVKGLYVGQFVPTAAGFPSVHVFTTIDGAPIEATFHTEEIKDGALIKATSSDGSVNVDLISTAPTKDSGMDINIKFTDSDGNPIEHVNYDIIATQNGEQLLDEEGVHTHTGQDSHSTEAASSGDPVDFQVKILGIGLPDDQANWSGPKDDVIPIHVTPEFGSIAMLMLGVAVFSIVAFGAKSKIMPKL